MAEIASLSLAANIFQMLEYGVKFVDTAWKIYASTTNAIDGFQDLQKLSKDLESVIQKLEKQDSSLLWQPSDNRESNNQALRDILEDCRTTSRDMRTSLIDIGLLPQRKPRKRDALKASFKLRWNEDNIRGLARRLEGCRSQLILVVVASLRYVSYVSLQLPI